MTTLLEDVARARDRRATAEAEFRAAIVAAHEFHSWSEIAAVAGLSRAGVRYLVTYSNTKQKGESDADPGNSGQAGKPRRRRARAR